MKKIFSICTVALGLLLITGCGNKDTGTIKCTTTSNGNPVTTYTTFNNNKITEVTFESSTLIPDGLSEQEMQQEMDLATAEFNKLDGVNATMKINGSYLIMSMKLDISKVSDETLKQFGSSTSLDSLKTSMSMKEYKERQEKQGFTCE